MVLGDLRRAESVWGGVGFWFSPFFLLFRFCKKERPEGFPPAIDYFFLLSKNRLSGYINGTFIPKHVYIHYILLLVLNSNHLSTNIPNFHLLWLILRRKSHTFYRFMLHVYYFTRHTTGTYALFLLLLCLSVLPKYEDFFLSLCDSVWKIGAYVILRLSYVYRTLVW